ncbi:MAG: hypothetical protein HOK21_08635 [Rhodospirillaceae bacterium]|jgi:lactate permease|nr:hypothetical protein [Rhodospirillaceae bacterium]MBT4686557.1 hypothetical protein [Rhodospirillaceae bacterium]MBT5082699.1 hypothetical protein [Rhodospirillaceae bacterium]MBT5524137.1 hypothetical protein [Rhodospirillaceae bacterium]MBT5879791.1 hypothetical protein [Rhodospirillaceae bacterium]
MIALFALLPCAMVIVAVMGFRQSGVIAAAIACLTALAIWLSAIYSAPALLQLGQTVTDALVIEALVASVVLPGIFFVVTSSRIGAPQAIATVMGALELSLPRTAILIATGIGVMVESLTGYGVSLLVTVPLLLNVVDRRCAIGLALVGMCLMPWGALSVAALLGAELAGLPVATLAAEIVWTSGPVAAFLPALCLLFVPKWTVSDLAYGVLMGVVLWLGIGLGSHWIGVEVAGVAGGMAVIALSALVARRNEGLGEALSAPALRPYPMLIAAVILQKWAVSEIAVLGFSPELSTGRVTFVLLSSPGIALFVVALLFWFAQRQKVRETSNGETISSEVFRRAWRALASILLFMITARLLVTCGAISALSDLLANLGAYTALAAVTILGATGGYVTGTGLVGNALFMTGAAATGANFDATALFAALQHSATSHTAMSALPVAAILLAALPNRQSSDDHLVMKTALSLAGFSVIVLILGGWLQLYMASN